MVWACELKRPSAHLQRLALLRASCGEVDGTTAEVIESLLKERQSENPIHQCFQG